MYKLAILLFLHAFLFAMSAEIEHEYKFPSDLLFGVASSAYQIEGAYKADGLVAQAQVGTMSLLFLEVSSNYSPIFMKIDGGSTKSKVKTFSDCTKHPVACIEIFNTCIQGKGENIYDFYTHKFPEKFNNLSNGDIACDSYNKWKEDVELLKELGVNFYRFSISWNRILPNGYANKINEAGVKFYNDLINELLTNGIEPMVTMTHFDLPMALQHLGGWANADITDHFMNYARILFKNFGDRVKRWLTINTSELGYMDGIFPPYINQPGIANYLSARNMVLAHAKAYRLYQKEFQHQKGKIGFVIDARWYEPASSSPEDIKAAEIVRDFEVGLYLNPIYHPNGDFPEIVKKRVEEISKVEGYPQSRLPLFSSEEIEIIKGSCDMIGANLYTSFLVKHREDKNFNGTSLERDEGADKIQCDSWESSASSWLKVYPDGARKILNWFKEKYNNPEIYITENGYSDVGGLNDTDRIDYLKRYLKAILLSIKTDKVAVKRYAVWSLMDNFEWASGYSEKFGLYAVDFNDPKRPRTKKKSATWYQSIIKEKRI